MNEDLTRQETNPYEEVRKMYLGLPAIPETNQGAVPRRDFGAPAEPKDRPTLDGFVQVVSALYEIPEGDRRAYRIEHEDYTDRVRTKIIAPNESFVEIAIDLPNNTSSYSARINFKERQRRTTALKIDLRGLKKKLAQKKLRDFTKTSPKKLKKILGLAH
ncbi:hypothetical protein GF371_04720 [Candidatus Woesearchaeota archaeon]|nr:hypothetical protein [Candidatus Woesearchaeota archaeon]